MKSGLIFCLLLLCGSASAQPLFTHAYSVEYLVANSSRVGVGTLERFEMIKLPDQMRVKATFALSETLKGRHQETLTMPLDMQESEAEAALKAKHPFILFHDSNQQRENPRLSLNQVVNLGRTNELAMIRSDFTVLTRPGDIIDHARLAIRWQPGAFRVAGFGLDVPPEAIKDVKQWRGYHAMKVTVPIDVELESWASIALGKPTGRLLDREKAAVALRHFRSAETIRKMKELLQDPCWAFRRNAENNDGLEVRVYLVRKAAWETLKYWGIEVEKPLITEIVRKFPSKKKPGPAN